MSTNGVNIEDTDMAECDGEKVVTMMDVLQEQQEFEEDANAVLGASDAKNCTYSEGYIKRQAIYACLTCCNDAKEDPTKRAGVCLACSLACHENHDLVELYTKRNFRCDCGNPKFNHPCQYTQNKTDLNNENSYNQNFSGLYCICHRPYPDPEGIEEEMIQCIVCEDWLHASHLEATVPSSELYAEMICKSCMEKNEFLHDYSKYAVNGDVDVCMNESDMSLYSNGDTKLNGVDEVEKDDSKCLKVDSNEVKGGARTSEVKERLEDNVTSPEETNGLTNNDDKAEEQTEPKISESENNDDAKAMETEITPIDASENENTDKDEVSGDKVLSEEQNSISAIEPENMEDSSEILPENKEEPNADNIKDSNDAAAENNADVLENAQESNNIDEHNGSDTMENAKESNNIEAESIADVTENAEESIKISDVTNNAEESTKVADNVADATDNVEESTNTDAEKANVPNIPKDSTEESTEVDDKNIAEEKPDEESSDKPQSSSIIDTPVDASESVIKPDEMENAPDETTENVKSSFDLEDNQIDSQQKQNDASELHVDSEDQDVKKNADVTENNSTLVTEEPTAENKRKYSTVETEDDVSVKKPKLGEMCVRLKSQRKIFKGATFWPSHFRQKLCTCNECITMYKDLSVLFLMDNEDTVTAYEALGKERTDGTASTQYEQGLEALSSLGRVQQINALTEYNKMRDKLLDFLKSFKDRKEVVKEEDIKAFFAGMKPKREPDGVYFCR